MSKCCSGKQWGKFRHITCHEGPNGEYRYRSALSLTSALDGSGWLTPRPSCFTPWKENRYPLYRRLGGTQGRSGRVRKISPSPGFDPRTVQPVADRAIPARKHWGFRSNSRDWKRHNRYAECMFPNFAIFVVPAAFKSKVLVLRAVRLCIGCPRAY